MPPVVPGRLWRFHPCGWKVLVGVFASPVKGEYISATHIARSDLMEESASRRVFLLCRPTRRPTDSHFQSVITYSVCVERRYMETRSDDPLLATLTSGGLAMLTMIGATIVGFVVDDLVHSWDKTGIVVYVLFDLLAAAACFLIVRKNPESVWYVPLIVNSFLIFSAIVEDNFWKNPPDYSGVPMWIPVCSGWVLCLVVSIVAAVKGGKKPPDLARPADSSRGIANFRSGFSTLPADGAWKMDTRDMCQIRRAIP